MPPFVLGIYHQRGVDANHDHHGNEFPKAFAFVNFKNKCEPIFGVVDMHRANL
jgi:hypothetical protein